VEALLGIKDPWRMVGAVAIGYPVGEVQAPGRKSIERVVGWFEE
jgi:hypothetical protein